MYKVHMRGAISAMMINILLVVIIAAAVAILMLRTEPDTANMKQASAPRPVQQKAAVTQSPSPATAPANGQPEQEIDAIKSRLEQEASRLEELRKQQELVENIRRKQAEREAEIAHAKLVEIQTAQTEVKAQASASVESAANGSETNQAAVEQNTGNSESKKPKRRLITPMGFPE